MSGGECDLEVQRNGGAIAWEDEGWHFGGALGVLLQHQRMTVFAPSSATPSRISRHTGSPKVGMR